jgi:hypothetical protein
MQYKYKHASTLIMIFTTGVEFFGSDSLSFKSGYFQHIICDILPLKIIFQGFFCMFLTRNST